MDFRAPTLADADGIVAMLVACDIADFGAPDYDRDALLSEWGEPGVQLERDAALTDGAYGILLGSHIRAWVYPDRRGEGLGAALSERLEARAREKGLDHVFQQLPSQVPAARELVEGRGYTFVRSYADLRLEDSEVAALPAGDVRGYDPGATRRRSRS